MNSIEISKTYQYKGSEKKENEQQAFFNTLIEFLKVALAVKNEKTDIAKIANEIAFDSAVFANQKDMYEFILTVYSHYADRQDRTLDQEIIFKKAEDIINNIDTDFNQVKPK